MNSLPLQLNDQEHCPLSPPITSAPPKFVPLVIQGIYTTVKDQYLLDGFLQYPIYRHIILDESRNLYQCNQAAGRPGIAGMMIAFELVVSEEKGQVATASFIEEALLW